MDWESIGNIGVGLTCELSFVGLVPQADVAVMVEVEEYSQRSLVELCGRSAHGAT